LRGEANIRIVPPIFPKKLNACTLPIMRALVAGALVFFLSWGTVAVAQDRMPPIAPEKYDEAQKKAAEEFRAARKEPVFGPFSVLIRSPELMNAYRTFGDYLRFKASAGNKLTEFIILLTAREWTQDFEWNFHAPLARKEGIGQEIIDAIADGRQPTGMSEDMEICYDLVTELQRYKRVSDATYARAVKQFGEKGVLDIVGISGYYASLAMVMSTTRMPMPPGGKRLSRFPE
jgi:4-carboxymuconolactone decarboxylase